MCGGCGGRSVVWWVWWWKECSVVGATLDVTVGVMVECIMCCECCT